MNKEEKLKAIKERFLNLEKENKLRVGNTKSRDFSQNTALNVAKEIVRNHLKNGFSEVPISFKDYSDEIGYGSINDFNHFRDKMLRLFEVAIITEIGLEDVKAFTGLYRKENTDLIRKHLVRSKHIKLVSNSEDERDLFLNINVSDLIQESE